MRRRARCSTQLSSSVLSPLTMASADEPSQLLSPEVDEPPMQEAQDIHDVEFPVSSPLPKQPPQHGYGGPSLTSSPSTPTPPRRRIPSTPYRSTSYPFSPTPYASTPMPSQSVGERASRLSGQLPPRPTTSRPRTLRATSRGSGFTAVEVESLLDTLLIVQPIGGEEWEMISEEHNRKFPPQTAH